MLHFLLYNDGGVLLLSAVVSLVLGALIWFAVRVAVTLAALALWRLTRLLRGRAGDRVASPAYRPDGKS